MKASEIIREGIAHIQKHGWTQNRYRERDGRCCAMGSIMQPHTGHPDNIEGYRQARMMLNEVAGPEADFLMSKYNDTPKRTRTQVLRKMGQAARRLEKQGQ